MADKERGAAGAMQVDPALVRQLAELLNDGDLSEIEVQDGERRIVVKRQIAAAQFMAAPAPAAVPQAAPPAQPAAAAQDVPPAAHPGAVKSPMVGTVYLSGEPGAAPFVAAGSRVEAGDTLLIIEAMKVMNQINAPRAGTVKQVLVIDAQPVEYDQPLVIIE